MSPENEYDFSLLNLIKFAIFTNPQFTHFSGTGRGIVYTPIQRLEQQLKSFACAERAA